MWGGVAAAEDLQLGGGLAQTQQVVVVVARPVLEKG